MRTSTPFAAHAAAVLFVAAIATGANAGPRIVNGLDTQSFPTTGALLYSGGAVITPANAAHQCTGTLIGCQTFLTAAHCVEEDTVASHYQVYLQHSGISSVTSITMHPSYSGFSGRDVAILKLADAVTGIDPTTINTTHDLDAMGVGLPGVVAGFGRTGASSDYAIKRYGEIVTADCDTSATDGEGNDRLVCWDYDASVGAPGEDSNTCNGDSGGPLFMTFSGSEEIVGVTSAGTETNCGPGDHSWDASVFYNAAWISGQLGADPVTTCGDLPPVGDAEVTVFTNSGSLSTGNPNDAFVVTLSGTPAVARFTMNGTDNGSFNPNFYVKQGAGAGPASYDCKADAASVFGACEFDNPATGTWSIYIERASGSGQYQVTTTVFQTDPPVCGNDVREGSEECDGIDDSACDGLCSGCACPAPVCGNDVLESGEECDGAAGGPCPGECLGDCSCPVPECGNGVLESGEECDGGDDDACPGECESGCSCPSECSVGDLYGLRFSSDDSRFNYKGWLFDYPDAYAALDPRDAEFGFDVVDTGGSVTLTIPASDIGWIRADPVRGRYLWKGDGSNDGLRRVKLTYKPLSIGTSYWTLAVKGRYVPGAGSINLENVLDFRLDFDGTCHTESW